MTYTQLFLRFLKLNNAYHLFVYNIRNRKENSKINNCLYDFNTINNVSVLNFLVNPFIWNKTKQGHFFWVKLYEKWDNAIRPYVGYSKRGYDIVTDYEEIIKKLNL